MARLDELTINEFYQTEEYEKAAAIIEEASAEIRDAVKHLEKVYPPKNGYKWKVNEVGVVYYGQN